MAMVCSLFKLIITPEFPFYGLQIGAYFNPENDNKPQNQPQKKYLPPRSDNYRSTLSHPIYEI